MREIVPIVAVIGVVAMSVSISNGSAGNVSNDDSGRARCDG